MGVKIFRNGAWEEIASKNDKSEIKYTDQAAENIFSSIAVLNEEYWHINRSSNSYLSISADRKILAFHMGFYPRQTDMHIYNGTPLTYYVCYFKNKNSNLYHPLGRVMTSNVDLSYHTYDNTQGINISTSYIRFRVTKDDIYLKHADPFFVDCIVYEPSRNAFKEVPEIYDIW